MKRQMKSEKSNENRLFIFMYPLSSRSNCFYFFLSFFVILSIQIIRNVSHMLRRCRPAKAKKKTISLFSALRQFPHTLRRLSSSFSFSFSTSYLPNMFSFGIENSLYFRCDSHTGISIASQFTRAFRSIPLSLSLCLSLYLYIRNVLARGREGNMERKRTEAKEWEGGKEERVRERASKPQELEIFEENIPCKWNVEIIINENTESNKTNKRHTL